MNSSTLPVDQEDDLLQGDIIRQLPINPKHFPRWGFILTADCDIFQKKAGQTYSWLEITRASDFLEQIWCQDQLKTFITKYAQSCLDPLNANIKKHHPHLASLDQCTLFEWLRESSVESILKSIVPANAKFDSRAKEILLGIQSALNSNEGEKLSTLRRCWTSAGISEKDQVSRIRTYLLSSDGFPDFFVIPDLPGEDGYCFIVMLRSISTIEINEIFKTELDGRIAGQSNSFHRVGRFNDNVRYAIVQKFSFLFSRIGMPPQFENASKAAADILVEGIFPRMTK